MEEHSSHKINRQIIELTVDTRDKAHELEKRVNDIMSNGLSENMETVMQESCGNNEYLFINNIEIDLGEIEEDTFESEFSERLLGELKHILKEKYNSAEKLHKVFANNSDESETFDEFLINNSGKLISKSESEKVIYEADYIFSLFFYFLQYGRMPWWAESISIPELEKHVITLLDSSDSSISIVDMLTQVSRNKNFVVRLLNQFSHASLNTLLSKRFNKSTINLENEVELFTNLFSNLLSPLLPAAEIQKIFYGILFSTHIILKTTYNYAELVEKLAIAITEETGLHFDEILFAMYYIMITSGKSELLDQTPAQTLIELLSSRNYDTKLLRKSSFIRNIIINSLTKEITTKTIYDELIEFKINAKTSVTNNKTLIAIIEKIMTEYGIAISKEGRPVNLKQKEKEISSKAIIKKGKALILDSLQRIKIIADAKGCTGDSDINTISQVFIKLILELEKIFINKNDYKKIVEEARQRIAETLIESGKYTDENISRIFQWENYPVKILDKILSESKIDKEYLTNQINEYKMIVDDERYTSDKEKIFYIENAGLVLLAPFYKMLFNKTELTVENKFISDKHRNRAVYLMQRVLNVEYSAEEHHLLLNKLLCGFDINYPIEKDIILTDNEQNECDNLVNAAIQHWSKIGNTSPEGFRESFLIREGKLIEYEEYWQLILERKAYDILIDSIPWSFSNIYYEWMLKLLRVEW